MMRRLSVLVAAGLWVWPLAAAAGVLIVERTSSGDAPAEVHQIQIEKDWMRMEHTVSGEKAAFVFSGARDVIWIVNYNRKIYNEMTKADVDRLGSQLATAMEQMQERLRMLRSDQREAAEAMLRGRGMNVPQIVFRKIGTDTVGRWTCDKYEGYQGQQKTSEICTVDPAALGFVASDFDVARKLGEFIRKLFPQNADSMFSVSNPVEGGFAGIPVRRSFVLGRRHVTTEATEVTRQTFPPSTFEIPAGFTNQSPTAR